ncbi:hypothetical protein VTJ83DRAFT_1721 [Remersonia thermophila]|uniref:Uncharacterized protein n=1 Tax=Remersonia thermophila TaxID=72144 RepID=A0ABR4DJ21_9PEZI
MHSLRWWQVSPGRSSRTHRRGCRVGGPFLVLVEQVSATGTGGCSSSEG